MAGDITYGVNVEYMSSGNLSLPSSVKDLEKGMSSGTSKIVKSLFDGAADFASALDKGLNYAMVGLGVMGVGALHALKTGLIEMNADVEQMSIGMAAMFSAHGNVDSFSQGLESARGLIKEMRKDARELPGEFKDLTLIMSTMATPALRNGMSIRETEKLAANAMASGMTHGIAPAVIGREMAAILAGKARGNMPMVTRGMLNLSVDATGLNAMAPDKRLATVKKALGLAGGPEAEAMESMKKAHMNSWIGLSSTIRDQVKQILGVMSYHVFERLKGVMRPMSEWFAANQDRIEVWANKVGWALAEGFSMAVHQLGRLGPMLQKIGEFIGKESALGRLPHDLGMVAGAAAALKVGTMVAPAVISGAGSLVGTEAVAAAGAGEAGAAAAGIGVLGLGIVETGGLLVGVLAVLAVAVDAIYGAFEGLTNTATPLHGAMVRLWDMAKFYFADAVASMIRSLEIIDPVFRRISEFLGGALLVALEIGAESLSKFAHAIENMLTIIANSPLVKAGLFAMQQTHPELFNPDGKYSKSRPDREKPIFPDLDRHVLSKPPNHTTHIGQVIIKVDGNADPRRVAKEIHGILQADAYFPKTAALPDSPAARWAGHR